MQLPAGNARWRFFHSGAALAAGLNLKAWREAGVYTKLAEQLRAAGAPAGAESFLPMVEELDEVWVVVDSAGRQAKPVILLTGRFSHPLWKQTLSTVQPLNGATAMLIGEPAAVAAVRLRLRLPTPSSKVAVEAEALSRGGDLWLTGNPRLVPHDGNQSTAMLEAVERVSLTMSFREKLTGELTLHTASPQAAENLLAAYRLIETQAATANPTEWGPVAKSLTVKSEPSALRFQLSVDPKDLAPVLAQRMKVTVPSPSGPRKTILIQGLEDGPREIPLGHALR
jgi:hypothetical protein